MTPCKSLILLSIFLILIRPGVAYFLSNPMKVPKNAGLRTLKISFAQRYPQNLWLRFKLGAGAYLSFLACFFYSLFCRLRYDNKAWRGKM